MTFWRNEHGEEVGGGFTEYDDGQFRADELKWLREQNRRGKLKPEIAEWLAAYDRRKR